MAEQNTADPVVETTGQTVEPSQHDEAPPARGGMATWMVVALVIAVGAGMLLVGKVLFSSDGEKYEPPPVPSASAQAPTEADKKPPKKEKKAKKEEPKEDEADKEEPKEEPAKPDLTRQCRDDYTIPDCREVTPDQLNKCGFCTGGGCSGTPSNVRLVCESQALVDYAASVAQSGKGTVNLCECQTQQAPAAQALSQASE